MDERLCKTQNYETSVGNYRSTSIYINKSNVWCLGHSFKVKKQKQKLFNDILSNYKASAQHSKQLRQLSTYDYYLQYVNNMW